MAFLRELVVHSPLNRPAEKAPTNISPAPTVLIASIFNAFILKCIYLLSDYYFATLSDPYVRSST